MPQIVQIFSKGKPFIELRTCLSSRKIFYTVKDPFILYSHNHGYWWHGHARSQFISSQDTDIVLPEYYSLCTRTGHYNDIIMVEMESQITSLTIVYSTVYSSADQRKHQSSASLAFVQGIHRWPVNSPHKWPVIQKMFSFDDVIM